MSKHTENLSFPSGLSVRRARAKAKQLVKSGVVSNLSQAQDKIALSEINQPWALAINTIQANANSGITSFMTRKDIQAIMEQQPYLTHFGHGVFRDRLQTREERRKKFEENRKSLMDAVDECNKACMFLEFVDKRKTLNNKATSYGLKHIAEYFLRKKKSVENTYIANGALICAAHFMGFDVKYHPDSPNVIINFSSRSPVIRWRNLQGIGGLNPNEIRELKNLEQLLGLPQSDRVAKYSRFLK